MARLVETTFLESTPQIDRENGILRDVKLLGENSANGRRYLPSAMRDGVPLYEGIKCYVDHPRRAELSEDRSFDRWAGTFHNPRYKEGQGIFADLHLRKSSDYFDGILEAAEKFPKDVGFSHVADGQARLEQDTEIVESIKKVFSGDLVTDPATTAGIFESRNHDMPKTKKTTVKEIAESTPESTKLRKLLIENMDAALMPAEMPVEVADSAEPAEQVRTALKQAVVGVVDKWFAGDVDEAATIAQIKKLFGITDKVETAMSGEAPKEPEKPAEPTAESKELAKLKRDFALMEAKTLLIESGREATEPRIKALASADAADRKSLLESWPKPEAGQTTVERPERSPGLLESIGIPDFPRDAKKFADAVR